MKFYQAKTTLLAAVIGMTFAGSALAADGTISINGIITDSTCDISVNNQAKDTVNTGMKVFYSVVDDFGAVVAGEQVLQSAQ